MPYLHTLLPPLCPLASHGQFPNHFSNPISFFHSHCSNVGFHHPPTKHLASKLSNLCSLFHTPTTIMLKASKLLISLKGFSSFRTKSEARPLTRNASQVEAYL